MGERLERFWRYYGQGTRTATRDTSRYGLAYVSSLLRLEAKRTIASIGRVSGVGAQNMQHFISQSPWSARDPIGRVQEAVAQRRELVGGVLIVDESGDEKFGDAGAGVARQYNGRHRQVERCQVGVYLAYVQGTTWTWLDGELYLPEGWFTADYAKRRQKAEIPAERRYQKKTELGWQMIQRARAAGIPFVAVTFDSHYGHEAGLRDQCRAAGLEYYADVKGNDSVYLQDPGAAFVPNRTGRIAKRPHVLQQWAYRVDELANHPTTQWHAIRLRAHERGILHADFAVRPVWTIRPDNRIVAETLLMRRDGEHLTFSLTNAPADTPLEVLAQRKSQRYFVERSIQDAKSEFGWDEFQAIKYRAWEHQLALTILASWFIAETRLDWAHDHPPAPALAQHYATDRLPALSVANVRDLLRAVLPLPQLSPQQAARLVVEHLDNRARSRRSRLKNRSGP